MMESIATSIFQWVFLKSRKRILEMMQYEDTYYYTCPRCEQGIRYGQQSCKNCKSTLTWIDHAEEKK